MGAGQFHDREFFAVLIRGALQSLVVFLQVAVILIFGIRFNDADHCRWIDKARYVVDMAVGVVADDAFTEPDKVTHTQGAFQEFLDLSATQVRIAVIV